LSKTAVLDPVGAPTPRTSSDWSVITSHGEKPSVVTEKRTKPASAVENAHP
jgi:hypothetical protein